MKPSTYIIRAYSTETGQLEAQLSMLLKWRAEEVAKELSDKHGLAFVVNGKTTMFSRTKGTKLA